MVSNVLVTSPESMNGYPGQDGGDEYPAPNTVSEYQGQSNMLTVYQGPSGVSDYQSHCGMMTEYQESPRMTLEDTETFSQIHFGIEQIGKRRPNTVKRVTWVFGVSNNAPHTVVMTWNKRTGEQSVEMDGEEVWFGRKPGASVCCHKWKTRDGLYLEILACHKTPMSRKEEGYRKYELMINSRSFSLLPNPEGQAAPAPGEEGTPGMSILDDLYPNGYQWEIRE